MNIQFPSISISLMELEGYSWSKNLPRANETEDVRQKKKRVLQRILQVSSLKIIDRFSNFRTDKDSFLINLILTGT
jgi:hypothetical protein